MRHFFTLVSLSLVLVVATGCGCHRHLPIQQVQRDSVVLRIRDSIAVRYVTVEVELPVESHRVVSSDSSHLETSLAISDSFIDSLGHLHHSLENKPGKLQKEIPVEEHFHSSESEHEHQDVQTITVEVERQLTWWQKFWISAGKVLSSILGAILIFYAGKFGLAIAKL